MNSKLKNIVEAFKKVVIQITKSVGNIKLKDNAAVTNALIILSVIILYYILVPKWDFVFVRTSSRTAPIYNVMTQGPGATPGYAPAGPGPAATPGYMPPAAPSYPTPGYMLPGSPSPYPMPGNTQPIPATGDISQAIVKLNKITGQVYFFNNDTGWTLLKKADKRRR